MFDVKANTSSKMTLDGLVFDTQGSIGQPLCSSILKSIHRQFVALLSHHSAIMVVRLESHVKQYSSCNAGLLRVLKRFLAKLRSRYGLKRIAYQWVREIANAMKPHYHLVIAVDGNKVNYPANIHKLWEQCHAYCELPKPYTPKNSYTNVTRGDLGKYREVIYRVSYLAKCRGKDFTRPWWHNYSSSRISMGNRLGDMFVVNNKEITV